MRTTPSCCSPAFKRIFLSLLVCLSTPALSAVPWLHLTNLTEAQFDIYDAQYRAAPYDLALTSLSGASVDGVVRYTALWVRPAQSAEQAVDRGMTLLELSSARVLRQALGWSPVWIEGFSHNNEARYNALWEKTSPSNRRVAIGLTLSEFQAAITENKTAGFQLRDMNSFNVGFTLYYNGVFHRAGPISGQWEFSYHQGATEFGTEFADRTSSGWTLRRVTGSNLTNFLTGAIYQSYSAVWIKATEPDWWCYYGLDEQSAYAEIENSIYQGYRLADIQVFSGAGEVRYNIICVRNGGMTTRNLNEINSRVASFMDDDQWSVGATVAISSRGKLVYARGFGVADRATGERMHPLHRIRIGSVSKTVTGHAILDLVDRGLLSLDDRLFGAGSLLGNTIGWRSNKPFSTHELNLRVRHLLTMTGGYLSDAQWDDYENPLTIEQVMDRWVFEHDPYFAPGNVYRYINANFALLGMIVEKISGMDYEDYCHERLIVPAGISPVQMRCLTGALDEMQSMEPVYHDRHVPSDLGWVINNPGGGWVARPKDMLLFLRRINQKTEQLDLLPESLLAQRFDNGNAATDAGALSNYGMSIFWGVFDQTGHPSRQWWGHNGGIVKGGSSFLIEFGDLAIMCHLTSGPTDISSFLQRLMVACNAITSRNGWPADLDLSSSVNSAYDSWIGGEMPYSIRNRIQFWPYFVAPDADPDDDNIANVAELYLGLDPNQKDRCPYTGAQVGDDFRVRWLRKTGVQGVRMDFQASSDLAIWLRPLGYKIENPPGLFTPVGYQLQELRLPMSMHKKRFVRFLHTVD